jgi:crotonobetaine/carnitine-CoA ligase
MFLTFPHFEPTFPRSDWTLPAVLRHQVRVRGDQPFLSWPDDGQSWTFAQVDSRTNQLAHGLLRAGVRPGEMVALLLPNCPEFVFTWFALAKIGAVEVAVSDAYIGEFLVHPLRLSKARLLVADAALARRVADIEESVPDLGCIYVVGQLHEIRELQPVFRRVELRPFEALHSEDCGEPGIKVCPSDPAAVLMTSGTTGPSKGVVMRHSHMYFFAEEDVQLTRLTASDVYMTGFPLFHGNAQFLTVYPCLIAGACCVLYPRFSASEWSLRAARSGATVTNLLGATMSFILDKPPRCEDKAHSVRCIYAAPLDPVLGGAFSQRFGVTEFVDGFGQTEISNIFMTPPGAARPAGASGVLVDQWFEARLVDPETGEGVPIGTAGELWIRPKVTGIVAYEYLGMPERTVEAWRDLWFHTGDMLRVDEDGWYYFVDRVKDALRRRGENISSFEVERGLGSHPSVAQCAVVGVQASEAAGEDEVMAFIVLKPGEEADPESLWLHCDRELPAFMRPRYIEFVHSLPVTATEKIRKKALRERGVGTATFDRLTQQPMEPA